MNGTIVVNTLGNVIVNGNVNVTGNLAAGTISPLVGTSSIVFDLTHSLDATQSADKSATPSGFGKLVILGQTNKPVASIDDTGNATFSGTLAAKDLAIFDPSINGATQSGSTAGNASIGTGTIIAGATQITIPTAKVTANSFIYITPTTNTGDLVLFLVDKIPGNSFTVGLSKKAGTTIRFNWWIVN